MAFDIIYNKYLPNDQVSIAVLFYQNKSDDIKRSFIESYCNDLLNITEIDQLAKLFNSVNYINAICIDDYDISHCKNSSFPNKVTNRKLLYNHEGKVVFGEEDEFSYGKDYIFRFYFLEYQIYDSIIKNDIKIINPNGRFYILCKNEFNSFIKESGISPDEVESFTYKQVFNDVIEGSVTNAGYSTIDQFIKFFLKNGKILFLGANENFHNSDTIYRNILDQKPLDFEEDIDSIVRYSVIAAQHNLYKDSSLWSEHILYKIPDGITVIDRDLNILYINEQRRFRHKNNILGKKCNEVFKGDNKHCSNCEYINLNKHKKYKVVTGYRKELTISDKCLNRYWIIENTTIAHLKSYTKHLGIVDVKDINFRREILQLSKNILRFDSYKNLFEAIEITFIQKLHFSNIRLYLNFGDTNLAIAQSDQCLSYNSPRLVLVHSNNSYQKNHIGLRVFYEDLTENSYIDRMNQNKDSYISQLQFFINGKTSIQKELTLTDIKVGTRVFQIFKDLQLPEKWLEIPLWDGDKLIGLIGVDFGSNLDKWSLVSNDIRDQLFNGAYFLSLAISNMLTNKISIQYKKLINLFRNIEVTDEKERKVCKYIEDCLIEIEESYSNNCVVLFYKNLESRIYKLSALSNYKYSPTYIDDSIYNLESNSDFIVLSDTVGKHILKVEKYKNAEDIKKLSSKFRNINSICDVYMAFGKRKYGIIRVILFGDVIIPLSYNIYTLLKLISKQVSEVFHEISIFEERKYFNKILQATTKIEINSETSISDYINRTFSNITAKKIFEGIVITVYMIVGDKLKLIGIHGITPNGDPLTDLYYQLPSEKLESNSQKINWLKTNRIGFTPTLLYTENEYYIFDSRKELNEELKKYYSTENISTKFDSFFPMLKNYNSEFIRKIRHNGNVIGLIRFQDKKESVFADNSEFQQFTYVYCTQIGHGMTFLKEIERLKDYEESLLHELKTAVVSSRDRISVLENIMGINIDEYFENQALIRQNDKDGITVFKSSMLPTLRVLRNENVFLDFMVKTPNIESIDWESLRNENFKTYNLRSIIIKVINYLRHLTDGNNMNISKDDDIRVIKFINSVENYKINGHNLYLENAFFNVIYNAYKYTFKEPREDPYFIEIKSDVIRLKSGKIFRVVVTNYGKTIEKHEVPKVFDKKIRGSNSKGIEGLGLGLYFAKLIFKAHDAKIRIVPFFEQNKTEVQIDFIKTET